MSELSRHRVAVTVFATVESVDERDGGHILTYAVRRALRSALDEAGHLPFESSSGTRTVRVHDVMDTGMAAGSGYLWLAPTSKAFRETGGDGDV